MLDKLSIYSSTKFSAFLYAIVPSSVKKHDVSLESLFLPTVLKVKKSKKLTFLLLN